MIQDWLLLQMNIEAVSLPLFVEVTAISTLIDTLPKKYLNCLYLYIIETLLGQMIFSTIK